VIVDAAGRGIATELLLKTRAERWHRDEVNSEGADEARTRRHLS
jgi:hypothetical protein